MAADVDVTYRQARKQNECLVLINQDVAGLQNSRVDVSQTALSQPGITISFQQKARIDIEELVYIFATGMLDFSLVWKPMDRPDGWIDLVIPEHGEEEGIGETWTTTRAVARAQGTGREITFGSMVSREQSEGHDVGTIDGQTERTQTTEEQGHSSNWGQSTGKSIQRAQETQRAGETQRAREIQRTPELQRASDIQRASNTLSARDRSIVGDEYGQFASETDTTKSATTQGTDTKHEVQRTNRKGRSRRYGEDRKEAHSARTTTTLTDSHAVGGVRSRKKTLTYRHHLLPRTREEWYPQGLLYSIQEQYAMLAKVLRMLGTAELLICWGNEPTRFCRVDEIANPFDGLPAIREWKVQKFKEWLWSVHQCFFTVKGTKKWDVTKEKSAAEKYS